MAVLTRITDFIPSTLIKSQEVDDELNQLVNLLSGVSTTKDTLLKFSDGTNPVLRVDQLGAGVIQQWLQNGTVKSRINNDGSVFTPAVFDTNGNEVLKFTGVGSAVNEATISNAATGGAPSIAATGGDTDINLSLAGKGTGRVVIKGYPYTLQVDTSVVGNVGGGQDNLQSYTVPINSLAANGDYIEGVASGNFAANNNDKNVQFSVGGTAIITMGVADLDSAIGWNMPYRIVRLSTTSVLVSAEIICNALGVDSTAAVISTFNAGSYQESRNVTVTGLANLTSNTLLLQFTGQGTSNDDVIQNLNIVKLVQR